MDDSMRLFILVGTINSDIQRSMKALKEARAKSGGTLIETVGRNQKVNYLVGRINGLCDAMKQLEEAEVRCNSDERGEQWQMLFWLIKTQARRRG